MATTAIMKTSLGDITMVLDETKAPESVKNFVQYANDGHFDGLIFHRVISGFMIQGGGMSADMKQRPTRAPIKNEGGNGLKNTKYSIAMARTSAPNSATAQFFINTKDNSFLDREKSQDGVGYAVFGEVTDGKEVVDEIEKVETGSKNGQSDVPKRPIQIVSLTIAGKTDAPPGE